MSIYHLQELRWHGGVEFQTLMGDRMGETQYIGMEAQTADRVITVSIFHVATHGCAHISGMNAYLILTSRLKLEFYKRIAMRATKHMEMSDGIFTTVIHRA